MPILFQTDRSKDPIQLEINDIKPKNKKQRKTYAKKEGKMEIWGGKLQANYIKDFLSASYDEKPPMNIGKFVKDTTLSGQRVQVYHDPQSGQAVVVHRGSQGVHDWGNNLKYALGFDMMGTKRFQHALDIQKKAESKYGAKNVSTLGHSLGANIANKVGEDSGEIITLNKPVAGRDLFKDQGGKKDNETSIRTSGDVVSATDGNTDFTIPSKSLNPLKEHSTDVVDRVEGEFGKSDVGASGEEKLPTLKADPQSQIKSDKGILSRGRDAVVKGFNTAKSWIGLGLSKERIAKLNKKQLKEIIKALPKVQGDGFRLVGSGKPQLVDYICERCGK
jgi:hypothetical protein